jgi:hypothetical protein
MTVIVFLQNNFRFDSFHSLLPLIEFNKWPVVPVDGHDRLANPKPAHV